MQKGGLEQDGVSVELVVKQYPQRRKTVSELVATHSPLYAYQGSGLQNIRRQHKVLQCLKGTHGKGCKATKLTIPEIVICYYVIQIINNL